MPKPLARGRRPSASSSGFGSDSRPSPSNRTGRVVSLTSMFLRLPAAHDLELDGFAGLARCDHREQILVVLHRVAVDLADDVVLLESGVGGRDHSRSTSATMTPLLSGSL